MSLLAPDPTVSLLRAAFPDGVLRDSLPVLRALYDHMSDRQLAAAASTWLGIEPAVTLNHVYRAAALSLTDTAVKAALAQLVAHGFNEWCALE